MARRAAAFIWEGMNMMEKQQHHLRLIKTISDAMNECADTPTENAADTVCIALSAVAAFMLGKSRVGWDFECLINIATAAQNSMAAQVNDWIRRQ